jgi:hypothetical protein
MHPPSPQESTRSASVIGKMGIRASRSRCLLIGMAGWCTTPATYQRLDASCTYLDAWHGMHGTRAHVQMARHARRARKSTAAPASPRCLPLPASPLPLPVAPPRLPAAPPMLQVQEQRARAVRHRQTSIVTTVSLFRGACAAQCAAAQCYHHSTRAPIRAHAHFYLPMFLYPAAALSHSHLV